MIKVNDPMYGPSFQYYACSVCKTKFGFSDWPRFDGRTIHIERKHLLDNFEECMASNFGKGEWKFCPNCGHKFENRKELI